MDYFFLARMPGFEPRKSGLESDGLPVSLRPKTIANCQLPIADLRFAICDFDSLYIVHLATNSSHLPIGNWQSAIENDLAEGTGLEPARAWPGSFQDYCLTS